MVKKRSRIHTHSLTNSQIQIHTHPPTHALARVRARAVVARAVVGVAQGAIGVACLASIGVKNPAVGKAMLALAP